MIQTHVFVVALNIEYVLEALPSKEPAVASPGVFYILRSHGMCWEVVPEHMRQTLIYDSFGLDSTLDPQRPLIDKSLISQQICATNLEERGR